LSACFAKLLDCCNSKSPKSLSFSRSLFPCLSVFFQGHGHECRPMGEETRRRVSGCCNSLSLSLSHTHTHTRTHNDIYRQSLFEHRKREICLEINWKNTHTQKKFFLSSIFELQWYTLFSNVFLSAVFYGFRVIS